MLAVSGRIAAVLGVAAVAAAALVAASVLPIPDLRAVPPSTVVEPEENVQVRVCPGPLLSLADDSTAATAARSIGSAAVEVAVEPADATVEQFPIEAPDDARSGVGPVALVAGPGSAEAGMLAGAQSQTARSETVSGFAAAACAEPAAESWLVAGATDVGRSGLVLLANPGEVASTVDVRVIGETGPVDAPAGLGVVVAPGTQRIVSLAGLAPNVFTPIVHVTSTGAPIAASLQHSVVLGLEPAGIELSTPTALPATRQVIPGFVVADRRGAAPDDDHVDGDDHPALRLFAPDELEANASIEVRAADGDPVTRFDVTAAAGQSTDLPLGELDPGTYTILIDADAPVVAAARSTVLADGGAGEGAGEDPIVADLAWAAATPVLLERAAVAVPAGPDPTLELANPTEEEVAVALRIDGDERTVRVPAGGAASVALDAGDRVVLDGVAGLHAALSFAGDDELAWLPVAPPGPLDAPMRVFPQ
ncbi:DUF5719 family protein [Agromyces marinus]|uniref:Large extracellular alpha-helical protein n=1 Tax=Agromyces marinus TaxID=1389020 RepID=A0ABN6YCH0_9MICO|nr:DUF5719 family protein [Agromyces marinus]BDZ53716.1 hypothetical protein GCM10025870_07890 [Agromyces marinus]